jgi:hypothetical protein
MEERQISPKVPSSSPKKTSLNKIPPKPSATTPKQSVLKKSGGLTVDTSVKTANHTELSPTSNSSSLRKSKTPSPVKAVSQETSTI